MTINDKRRHKILRRKYSQFYDALNKYNRFVSRQEQIMINKELSKITDKIFKVCDL